MCDGFAWGVPQPARQGQGRVVLQGDVGEPSENRHLHDEHHAALVLEYPAVDVAEAGRLGPVPHVLEQEVEICRELCRVDHKVLLRA